jgi:hypothetical protein
LLFTCRHTFTLPSAAGKDLAQELLWLQLPPMQTYESKKQAAAKVRLSDATDIQQARTDRCIACAKGNPGLQDLLLRMGINTPDQCDQALDEMSAYLASGAQPGQQELIDLFENLAMDKLMQALSDSEKALLRASTLFVIPVPLSILQSLAEQTGTTGGAPFGSRLLGLGVDVE